MDQNKWGSATHTHPPACTVHHVQQYYISSTAAETTHTAPDPRIHPPNHPPCTAAQQHVQQQYVSTLMRRSLLHRHVFTIPRGDGSFRRSPHVGLGVEMHGSTTAAVLTAEAARSAPDPPTHSPNDSPCTAAQLDVSSFIQRLCCCILLGLSCFYDPPPCRGLGTAPFDVPR